MEIIRWSIFITFGFISFIPVIRLSQYKQTEKYTSLRYFVTTVFAWTILTYIVHIVDNFVFIYYVDLLIFPLIFLIVYSGFETVQTFINKHTHPYIRGLAVLYFTTYFIASITNDLHQLVQRITSTTIENRDSVLYADFGPFFMINVVVSYLIIFNVMRKLTIHLKHSKNTQDSFIPFALLIVIVFLGLLINVTHVFVFTFPVDPTYVFIVSFAYYLYWIVFTKDFHYRLLRGSRNELINAMREQYIIAEENGDIIEYSQELENDFDLTPAITTNLTTFTKYLNEHAVLFEKFDDVKDKPFKNINYYYTVTKEFNIPGLKRHGKLVLLYDETNRMKLVDQLNYTLKYDSMTNLYNRNFFDKNFDAYNQDDQNAGIILSDINGLKLHNDYLGHRAGDTLIKKYAKILSSIKDDTRHVFRLGGDEFLIYLTHTTTKELKEIKTYLLNQTNTTVFPEKISVSVGVALRRKNETLTALLHRADQDLYKEKDKASPLYKESFIAWYNKK